MCDFFVKADPIQYEPRTRTLRIHGVLTSLRLENMTWDILAEMAEAEGCTTNALISLFHDEILARRGEVPNFASFLRVTCMRYLRRAALSVAHAEEAAEAVESDTLDDTQPSQDLASIELGPPYLVVVAAAA